MIAAIMGKEGGLIGLMDLRETKRDHPGSVCANRREQPISQTTAKSIAEETAENNPQEESLKNAPRYAARATRPTFQHGFL